MPFTSGHSTQHQRLQKIIITESPSSSAPRIPAASLRFFTTRFPVTSIGSIFSSSRTTPDHLQMTMSFFPLPPKTDSPYPALQRNALDRTSAVPSPHRPSLCWPVTIPYTPTTLALEKCQHGGGGIRSHSTTPMMEFRP